MRRAGKECGNERSLECGAEAMAEMSVGCQ